MGRRRRQPEWGKTSGGLGVSSHTARIIEERLGHLNPVCANCQTKNPRGADKCKKCGRSDLRKSAKHPSGKGYRDE